MEQPADDAHGAPYRPWSSVRDDPRGLTRFTRIAGVAKPVGMDGQCPPRARAGARLLPQRCLPALFPALRAARARPSGWQSPLRRLRPTGWASPGIRYATPSSSGSWTSSTSRPHGSQRLPGTSRRSSRSPATSPGAKGDISDSRRPRLATGAPMIRQTGFVAVLYSPRWIARASVPLFILGDLNAKSSAFCSMARGGFLHSASGGNVTGDCHPLERSESVTARSSSTRLDVGSAATSSRSSTRTS